MREGRVEKGRGGDGRRKLGWKKGVRIEGRSKDGRRGWVGWGFYFLRLIRMDYPRVKVNL